MDAMQARLDFIVFMVVGPGLLTVGIMKDTFVFY
jgi:hypothetical protein